MDWWWWIVIAAFVIGPIIGGAIHTTHDTNKFASLGDIRGMPINEILERVGQPSSISTVPEGTLYQWQRITGSSGYHYAIMVDAENNAVGYTHQHVS